MRRVTVVGMGRFGYAITCRLDRKACPKSDLWFYGHRQDTVEALKANRHHPDFFQEYQLSDYTKITDDLAQVVQSDVLVLALSSAHLAGFLREIKPLITKPMLLVHLIKALDRETGLRMSQVIETELDGLPVTVAALAGGTIDADMISGQLLGMTIASQDEAALKTLCSVFNDPKLDIELTTDIVGCELAGAFKSIVAMATGLAYGLGHPYGGETLVLSRVAGECSKLAVSLGANRRTFYVKSQCWGNDMIMSAMGANKQTRNRTFGIQLGQGNTYAQTVELANQTGKLAEGVNTIAVLPRLANLEEYPLLRFMYELSVGEAEAAQLPEALKQSFCENSCG
jgi:glycerol-3-phosphate dehydrogenase (NAD(P)+)